MNHCRLEITECYTGYGCWCKCYMCEDNRKKKEQLNGGYALSGIYLAAPVDDPLRRKE